MSIDQISQSSGAYQVQKNYLDAKRKAAAPSKEETPKISPKADKVEISEDAKKMITSDNLIQEGLDAVKNLPEEPIREDRVRQSEVRIVTGHYDRKDVLEKIVDFLIERDDALENESFPLTMETLTENQASDIRYDRLELIQQRITDNFYDQIEVLDNIAGKLLGV
jgi:hypothetical protein